MTQSHPVTASIHDLVEQSAIAVQDIHQAIADLPIDVLDTLTPFHQALGEVRQTQARSIAAVYGLVRKINDRVEQFADDLLSDH